MKILITFVGLAISLSTHSLIQAMEINQQMYGFQMTAVQNVTSETFVITNPPPPVDSCSLPHIHFPKNSADLIQAEFLNLLSKLQQCGIVRNTLLTTTGYTCQLGPNQLNQTLSLQRASAVAKQLREHGYIVTEVQGKGSLNPISHNPTILSYNRRVEVKVTH